MAEVLGVLVTQVGQGADQLGGSLLRETVGALPEDLAVHPVVSHSNLIIGDSQESKPGENRTGGSECE